MVSGEEINNAVKRVLAEGGFESETPLSQGMPIAQVGQKVAGRLQGGAAADCIRDMAQMLLWRYMDIANQGKPGAVKPCSDRFEFWLKPSEFNDNAKFVDLACDGGVASREMAFSAKAMSASVPVKSPPSVVVGRGDDFCAFVDRLERLASLYVRGLLSEEEYRIAKLRLLG